MELQRLKRARRWTESLCEQSPKRTRSSLSPQLCRQSLLSCVRYFQIARQQVLAVYKCFHPRNTGGEPRCCSFFAVSLKRKTARKQYGIYLCLDDESLSFFPPRCSNRLMVFQSPNSTSEVSAVLVAAAVAPSAWKVICVCPQARGQFYASLIWEDKKMCRFLQPASESLLLAPPLSVPWSLVLSQTLQAEPNHLASAF